MVPGFFAAIILRTQKMQIIRGSLDGIKGYIIYEADDPLWSKTNNGFNNWF